MTTVSIPVTQTTKEAHEGDKVKYWTIHNKRYDLTQFVQRHPGGDLAIKLGQGRNCTELFESYHSLTKQNVHQILAKFYVEDVPKGSPDFDDDFEWTNTPFYDALKTRVKAYFGDKTYKATPEKWAMLSLMFVLYCLSVVAFFQGYWFSIITMPVFHWLGPSAMMHDGTHFSLSKNPAINKFCAYLGCAHVSVTLWLHQHVIGHHVKTNLPEKDPDHVHFRISSKYVYGFRTHVRHKWYPRYVLWRKGIVTRAFLTAFAPCYVQDFFAFITGKYHSTVHFMPLSTKDIIFHFIGRFTLFFFAIITPFIQFPLWKAIPFATVPYAILGLVYYIFSQISHINEESFVQEGKKQEWAAHQVQSAKDYCTTSPLWQYLSIGLNNQGTHHLFPQIDPVHYRSIEPIIERTCQEFGIPYKTEDNILTMMKLHLNYIGKINELELKTIAE